MNIKIIKVTLLCIILLLFDLIRPLGYSLNSELAILGIFFLAYNLDLNHSLLLAAFLGLCKDSFSLDRFSFSAIEFPLLCILIYNLSSLFIFNRRPSQAMFIKSIIVFFCLLLHAVYSSLLNRVFDFYWSLSFIFQSYLIWFMINYCLKQLVIYEKTRN
ncbi:MAG: hypothetical protein JW867_08955 [Candidatus Omnitrophica bacterium]|nr:hypothetical protein [Candidatus Omnitrophota bacterium]